MNRFSPNPHLIAPSTEQRMVLAADGDYVLYSEALALKAQRDALDRALHELASACGISDKEIRALVERPACSRPNRVQLPVAD
jgi:hypothetical protein